MYDENGNEYVAVTDSDGYVTFNNLISEKTYTYKEKIAPTGYVLNTNTYSFSVTKAGTIVDITGNRIIENDRITASVTITKLRTGTTVAISGAVIGIYDEAGNAITDENGKPIQGATGADGKVTFAGLTIGKYKYKEEQAPTGYVLNNTMYEFTVNADGTITFANNTQGIIYNDEVKGIASIIKKDKITDEVLAGAEITLYDEAGNVIETKTTGVDGIVTFGDLIIGKNYKYQEVTQPTGYVLNNTMYTLTVKSNGEISYTNYIEINGKLYGVIYNEPIKYSVGIIKKDKITDEVLSGAVIGIYDETGNAITDGSGNPIQGTTGIDGRVTLENLQRGKTYKYREITAPTGYLLNDTMYEFTVNEDGTITFKNNTKGIIYDEPIRIDVPIYKIDAVTKEILKGATIELYNADGTVIEKKVTDENGNMLFTGLIVGRTYKYKEITAPEGYTLNDTTYEFTINKDGTIVYNNYIEINGQKYLCVYDEPIRIDVPIYKIDAVTKEILKGATIELYNADGTVIEKKVTDENGNMLFTGLIVGRTYKYKEITAPEGYTLNDTTYEFTINKDGTIVYNNYIEINGQKYLCVYDEPIRIDVPIYKIDAVTKAVLKGATIALYNADGTAIEQKVTNENGNILFTGLIVGRTYRYKEIIAPDGYKLNEATYEFTINKDGSITFNNYVEINGQKYICIYDSPEKEDVVIIKRDKLTGVALTGAVIGIYDGDKKIVEGTTDEEGKVIFSGFTKGAKYTYREITAPTGYKLNKTVYSFTVNDDGTITYNEETKGIIYDEPIEVTITKKEILTEKLLSGAVIGLYNEDGSVLQTSNGEARGTTGEEGTVKFIGLIAGKTYKYKEIEAPIGYAINKTEYTFTIETDGTVVFKEDTNGVIYNERLKVNVPIIKKEKGTGKLLSGAVIGLYDTSGNAIQINDKDIVVTTNSLGQALFTELEVGKVYQYKEIEAPSGYNINLETYVFRIKEDGTIVYDGNEGIIYDEKIPIQNESKPDTPKLPQTGINTVIFGTLMALTGISITGTIYYRRKLKE